jgi:hypothetical protein
MPRLIAAPKLEQQTAGRRLPKMAHNAAVSLPLYETDQKTFTGGAQEALAKLADLAVIRKGFVFDVETGQVKGPNVNGDRFFRRVASMMQEYAKSRDGRPTTSERYIFS